MWNKYNKSALPISEIKARWTHAFKAIAVSLTLARGISSSSTEEDSWCDVTVPAAELDTEGSSWSCAVEVLPPLPLETALVVDDGFGLTGPWGY